MEKDPSLVKDGSISTSDRLITVDFARGLGVIGVLLFHQWIYGVWKTEENALNSVPMTLLLILFPIVILGTWAGGFPLISGITNAYNAYRRMEKGIAIRVATRPMIIYSLFLILLDPIRSGGFNRTWFNEFGPGLNYSIVSGVLDAGKLMWPITEKIFQIGSLPAIGLSGIFIVIILRIIFRGDHRKDTNRIIITLTIFGIILSLVSNFIAEWLTPYVDVLYLQGGLFRFLAYILRMLVGGQLSFFPLGTYSVFGIVLGYMLVQRQPLARIQKWGRIVGIGYLIAFLTSLVITVMTVTQRGGGIEDVFMVLLAYEIYPREWLFLSLGAMILIGLGLIKHFEYSSEEKRLKRIAKTKWLQEMGAFSLTPYITEPLWNGIIALIFHRIVGGPIQPWPAVDSLMTNWPAIILFLISSVVFWVIYYWIWKKLHYRYGFEYFLLLISQKVRKVASYRAPLMKLNTATEE
jgi:hypothetical protein